MVSLECEEREVGKIQSMAGNLGHLSVAVAPIACFEASLIQQTVP